MRLILVAFVLFLVLPPLQCLALRWLNPPCTETMIMRAWISGRETGQWSMPAQQWRTPQQMPRSVMASAMASEDRGFLHHHGFDWPAIRRAWRHYSDEPGTKLVGGSTISQQVSRNVFLWQHRSWLRKGLEAWYTVWLEVLVPKERILEVYVNIAEMGPMTFGIGAASQYWFHHDAGRLTPLESAQIIALLPAPNHRTVTTPLVQRKARWIAANPVRVPW